jgi:hypothetical protein
LDPWAAISQLELPLAMSKKMETLKPTSGERSSQAGCRLQAQLPHP